LISRRIKQKGEAAGHTGRPRQTEADEMTTIPVHNKKIQEKMLKSKFFIAFVTIQSPTCHKSKHENDFHQGSSQVTFGHWPQ